MERLIAALFALIIAAETVAADVVVFSATPSSRVTSNEADTKRETLSQSQQQEFRILITKKDRKYYWSTRENRELIYSTGGAFHYFIDPRGGGYIKIFDTSLLPESFRKPSPRFAYIEHNHLWLKTITYWGTANALEP